MKLLLAALLALTQAAQAAAPKVVVPSKAGLGGPNVPLAKPGILNNGLANPLGGSPLVNVPAIVNSGVPVLAPNVSQAPVLDGLTGVVNKQAELGRDQNAPAAIGGQLFDGSGKAKLGDVGDPVNGGFKGGDPYRTSGLSPPTREDVAKAYQKARYKSLAEAYFGDQFPEAAAEVFYKYTFQGYDMLQGVAQAAHYDKQAKTVLDALSELIGVHDSRDEPASAAFRDVLGRWYAGIKYQEQKAPRKNVPHLTPNPLGRGEYWDMAAGLNAGGYIMREVDSASDYSFFDLSGFVTAVLNETARLAGKPNAKAVQENLLALKKPAKPLSVLRTKNAIAYVPGFDKKLEEMADWVAPGGQLVIQNDPNPGQRSLVVKHHGPLIRDLLSKGWAIEYGFSRKSGPFSEYGFDTLVLVRPAALKTVRAREVNDLWNAYVRAVKKADDEFNPFGGLFTVILGG